MTSPSMRIVTRKVGSLTALHARIGHRSTLDPFERVHVWHPEVSVMLAV